MLEIQTHVENGIYYTVPEIPITVDMWEKMLVNEDIFYDFALQMLYCWYHQPNYTSTSKNVMICNNITTKMSPFNGIVVALGKRIIKHLNSFYVLGTNGKQSYWQIVFDGWHESNPPYSFVWKIKDNLVQAMKNTKILYKRKIQAYSLLSDEQIYPDEIIETQKTYIDGAKK